MNYLPFFKKN